MPMRARRRRARSRGLRRPGRKGIGFRRYHHAVDGKRTKDSRSKPGSPEEPELGFEEALEQVEAIIEKVESGQIGLEDSIAQYERGAALILRCRKILDRAEQRVQELTAQMSTKASGGDEGPGGPRD